MIFHEDLVLALLVMFGVLIFGALLRIEELKKYLNRSMDAADYAIDIAEAVRAEQGDDEWVQVDDGTTWA